MTTAPWTIQRSPRAPIPSELEQREDEARQQPDEEWERLLRVLDGPPKPKP
jgi:hypothetical protein